MAQRFWPGESALGKRLRPLIPDTGHYWLPKSQNRSLTVVGIAGDVKLDGVTQNLLPQMYLPSAQNPSAIFHLVVRTADNPGRLSTAVRQAVLSIDRDQPVFDEKSLDDVLAGSIARVSMVTRGLAIVAAIALLLACAGIYGITSYIISQRNRESAIRMALGANPGRLVALQMRRTMAVMLIGSCAGLIGALAGTQVLKSMLVGVATTDVVSLTAAPLFFVLIATLATWLPARRVAQVDPLTALRQD
jgi:predicted lysophospholipase L1 biosynthesis ABC-type transport system permease subunit